MTIVKLYLGSWEEEPRETTKKWIENIMEDKIHTV